MLSGKSLWTTAVYYVKRFSSTVTTEGAYVRKPEEVVLVQPNFYYFTVQISRL